MPKTHTKKGWLLINKRGPVPLPGTFRPIFSYDKKEVTIWRNRPEHIVPAVLTWEKLEEEK